MPFKKGNALTFFAKLVFLLILSIFVFSDASFAAGASLEFDPESVSLEIGDQAVVYIIINTLDSEVAGAGARILYDPKIVAVTSVEAGEIFGDYPSVAFDNVLGTAVISGIVSSSKKLYSGRGILGTMKIQGVSEGKSEVLFEFEPGSTKDSNIAVTYGTGDILASVNKLEVSVSKTSDAGGSELVPTVPVTSEEVVGDSYVPEKKRGIIDKILNFFGIKSSKESSIDPYDPIPSQAPNRSSSNLQMARGVQGSSTQGYGRVLIILAFLVILSLVLLLVIRKVKRSKNSKAKVEHIDI